VTYMTAKKEGHVLWHSLFKATDCVFREGQWSDPEEANPVLANARTFVQLERMSLSIPRIPEKPTGAFFSRFVLQFSLR